MLLGKRIDQHIATSRITYELIQTNVVGMGKYDRVFSFTIYKKCDGKVLERIINGVKNKDAAYAIWEDVKKGEQK